MTQVFKGDETELALTAAAKSAFDVCSISADDFLENGYTANDFLLMLYDEGRMPFSDRVPRDVFCTFMAQAIPNFPYTGTFDAYVFIMNSIFGEGTPVWFEIETPGVLSMMVNAAETAGANFLAREYGDGGYSYSEIVTWDGDYLEFTSISGIESEAQLTNLLAELIPAGIFPDIAIVAFYIYSFITFDGDLIVDTSGNQIVFYEV